MLIMFFDPVVSTSVCRFIEAQLNQILYTGQLLWHFFSTDSWHYLRIEKEPDALLQLVFSTR